MPDANTQLREYSREYGKKKSEFGTDYRKNNGKGDNSIAILIAGKRFADVRRSAVPHLYSLLKKNADKISQFGQQSYPVLSYDSVNKQLSNSPALSSTLNKYSDSPKPFDKENKPSKILDILGSLFPNGADYKGEKIHPCIVSYDGGRTQTDFYGSKFKHPRGLQELVEQNNKDGVGGLSKTGLAYCGKGEECYDCIDCKAHQEEIRNSLAGITSDKGTDDGVRLMHVKNLISTLNSWASHQDSRGGDKETQSDPSYEACYPQHQTLATNLRIIADEFHNALDSDYKTSNGTGGGKHRDIIYGDNKVGY